MVHPMTRPANRQASSDMASIAERPTRVRYMVFVLGFGTSWMLYLHRYSFALIKPFLKEELDVSNTELGYMDAVFGATYFGVQFPTGLWGDVAGVHWLLGGLILLWSVSLAMHAWAPNVKILYAARALLGAGQAGVFSLVGRLTRSWIPLSVRTTAQGWIGVAAGRLGGLSANLLLMTVMIGIMGLKWQLALYILAGVGITHGLAFLALFRNSPAEHPWANDAEADLVAGDSQQEQEKPLKIGELVRQMEGSFNPQPDRGQRIDDFQFDRRPHLLALDPSVPGCRVPAEVQGDGHLLRPAAFGWGHRGNHRWVSQRLADPPNRQPPLGSQPGRLRRQVPGRDHAGHRHRLLL
ncbi:MAG: hypothetical protein CM1200mP2_10610 [Planctomycetaceae bacterium]|nr:MAG: hypothetical protein CM1200mP2_10610 [Planctomycetaceae bacterium]